MRAEGFADVFFVAAKVGAPAAFSLSVGKAQTLEIVSAILDARARLFVHVILDLGTTKKPSDNRTNVCRNLHISSVQAASSFIPRSYSYRKATMGSTRIARRAGM